MYPDCLRHILRFISLSFPIYYIQSSLILCLHVYVHMKLDPWLCIILLYPSPMSLLLPGTKIFEKIMAHLISLHGKHSVCNDKIFIF